MGARSLSGLGGCGAAEGPYRRPGGRRDAGVRRQRYGLSVRPCARRPVFSGGLVGHRRAVGAAAAVAAAGRWHVPPAAGDPRRAGGLRVAVADQAPGAGSATRTLDRGGRAAVDDQRLHGAVPAADRCAGFSLARRPGDRAAGRRHRSPGRARPGRRTGGPAAPALPGAGGRSGRLGAGATAGRALDVAAGPRDASHNRVDGASAQALHPARRRGGAHCPVGKCAGAMARRPASHALRGRLARPPDGRAEKHRRVRRDSGSGGRLARQRGAGLRTHP